MNAEQVIVVIEDDPNIADLLNLYLRKNGYRVLLHADGETGLAAIADHTPDLVILDVGLPGAIDGLEVCRRLRAANNPVAVLMLTARDDEIDRVLGLEMGADDYVTKPFSPREIVARVKAIMRRTDSARRPSDRPVVHAIAQIEVDTGRREARVEGTPVALATREYDLLEYLARHAGLALSRQQLLDGVWGLDWVGDERTVDVHIRQLRRKLGDDVPLATIWGVGYRLG